MNKKIVVTVMALALPLAVVAFPGGGGHFKGPGHRLEWMAEKLDLTAEQKDKLEVIFKDEREKLQVIRKETHSRMQEVLTPEQMTKLDDIKKSRHEKWLQRHEEWKNKGPGGPGRPE
ncbi:MAG: Spy/CpxP family protein refolding chaperone [Gammaproteobacteria bacterium]